MNEGVAGIVENTSATVLLYDWRAHMIYLIQRRRS